MENSKLIQDFLDGRLDADGEDTLFGEIANNPVAREEFKGYLAIELALKNDSKTFIPPLSSTTGILSRIGFAIPGAIAGAAAVSTFAGKGGFFSTITQGIYSAIVSAVVTAVAVVGYYSYTDNSKQEIADVNNSKNVVEQQINFKNNELNKAQNEIQSLQTKLNNQLARVQKPIYKYIYIERKSEPEFIEREILVNDKIEDNKIINTNIATEKFTLNKISESNSEDLKYIRNPKIYSGMDNIFSNVISNDNYKFGNFDFYSNIGLGFELRGFQEWNTKTPAVKESNIPKFANMGLTLSLDLTDDLSLLADARQEYFYQEYTGIDDLGNNNLYQQFPNFYSFSAGLRYNFLNFENISAFGQILAGGNKAGIVGRTMLGLEIFPMNNFSYFIGIEGSMMDYFHKENRFQTSKIGLNYGIKYNF